MRVQHFVNRATPGAVLRFAQWDDADLSTLRDLISVFGSGGVWEVRPESHAINFYKDGVLKSNIAPGDWMQLDTFTSAPSLLSDSNLHTNYNEIV